MRHAERVTPIAAATAALMTLVCCLPAGFAVAAATASVAAIAGALRPWLIGASVLLLAIGFVQSYRGKACQRRRSGATVIILWISAAVVALVILFPQAVAAAMAGLFWR